MQQDPATDPGVDLELSRPVDLVEYQVLQVVETRFAVCMCPSADRCEWDRPGRRFRNIREAFQAGRLDPHEGIDRGVERLGTIENLQSDVVALQPLAAPGQSFIDEVLQEPLPAL